MAHGCRVLLCKENFLWHFQWKGHIWVCSAGISHGGKVLLYPQSSGGGCNSFFFLWTHSSVLQQHPGSESFCHKQDPGYFSASRKLCFLALLRIKIAWLSCKSHKLLWLVGFTGKKHQESCAGFTGKEKEWFLRKGEQGVPEQAGTLSEEKHTPE